MTERLLQFIWQFQYFNKNNINTVEGEPVQIIKPGLLNTNQGPDFLDAKIKIGNTVWAGSIEMHINSSGWNMHKHADDENYKNVILHVVWNADESLSLPFSTIQLKDKVSKVLLDQYKELMATGSLIPCNKSIKKVKELVIISWKERLLAERLQDKSKQVFDYLKKNNNHWEETFWWMIAKNFGIKVNSDAFEKTAQSIPINLLAKHKNQIHQVEALLFGQAGLLTGEFTEDYPGMLQKEYQFLKTKYQLTQIHIPLYFLRMRPANFPTIRLAQLAMLVNNSVHLFAAIKESNSIDEIENLLNVTANDYWHYHYKFDEESPYKIKHTGNQMINNIIINTIAPVIFAYGLCHNDNNYKEKAIKWLQAVTAEKNVITKSFEVLGLSNKNAFDSQALIQLKNVYCNHKKCLDCAIGNALLKNQD